jgi:hypothetical protein
MKMPNALKRPAMALAVAGLMGLGAGYGVGSAIDQPIAAPALSQDLGAPPADAQRPSPPAQPDVSAPAEIRPDAAPATPAGEDGEDVAERPAETASRNLSPDLRLAGAEPDIVNLNDDQQEYVSFRYTEPVQRIIDETAFVLAGPEADQQVHAESARVVTDDGTRVLAAFPAGTDVRSHTIAWSTPGAVENRGDQGSIPSAVELEHSRVRLGADRTTGPDLLGVHRNETLNRISYGFDEQLDEGPSPEAAAFAYYDRSGTRHDGQAVLSVEDNVVVVQFDDAEGDVGNAVRYSVAPGSIADSSGTANVARAVGGQTSVPDLVRVERSAVKTQFDFTFDQTIEGVDAAKLALHSSDGTRYEADSFTRPSPDVVRANFPQVRDFAGELVLATADAGSVHATSQDGQPSTLGSADLARTPVKGDRTTGPDLLRADIDRATGQVVFRFDEPVDDDRAVDPSGFLLITEAGHLVPGHSAILLDGHRAVIVFDENVADAARAAGVDAGAVTDFQGQPNPVRTIDVTG